MTICTHHNECTLGVIKDGQIVHSDLGKIVHREWCKSAAMRAEVEIDEFVIMPNHLHGIVIIHGDDQRERRATNRSPLRNDGHRIDALSPNVINSAVRKSGCKDSKAVGPVRRSLGAMIAGFKSAVTSQVNMLRKTPRRQFWQRNYYEHVIRSEESLFKIRKYILENPMAWQLNSHSPFDLNEFVNSLRK